MLRLIDKNGKDIVAPAKNSFWERRVHFMYQQEKKNGAKLVWSI